MLRRLGLLGGLLLLVPASGFAQTPVKAPAPGQAPETLLAAESLVYFRYDGLEAHRKAFDQTALAEILRGDLGDTLDYVMKVLQEQLGPSLLKDKLLEGASPDQLIKLQNAANQMPHLIKFLGNQGFLVGLEFMDLQEPRFQVTVVFPNGGEPKNRSALTGAFRLFAVLNKIAVKENKTGDRDMLFWEAPLTVALWQEGSHMVLVIGTEKVEHTLALVDGQGKRANLTKNPLHQSVAGFKAYDSIAYGFVDLEGGVKLARTLGDPANKIIDELGLAGLKNLTLHIGFEGKYQRTTVVLRTTGERKGVLRLLNAPGTIDLDKLPPIPPDATTVGAMHLDLANAYDVIRQSVEVVVGVLAPAEKEKVIEFFKEIDKATGVDVRKDLLGSLGTSAVVYSAPSEGPFMSGFCVALQVKDAKKLQEALEVTFKTLPASTGVDLSVDTRDYRGAKVHSLTFNQRDFPLTPSYAVHNGWLYISLFPQTVQGAILRSGGKYSTWKPSAELKYVLAEVKKNPKARITGIVESDPRPTVKQLMSIAPFIGALINAENPGLFKVSMLPNAQSITEHLFHNVAVTVDEGDAVRFEAYSSLPIPFDVSGAELFILAFGARFLF